MTPIKVPTLEAFCEVQCRKFAEATKGQRLADIRTLQEFLKGYDATAYETVLRSHGIASKDAFECVLIDTERAVSLFRDLWMRLAHLMRPEHKEHK